MTSPLTSVSDDQDGATREFVGRTSRVGQCYAHAAGTSAPYRALASTCDTWRSVTRGGHIRDTWRHNNSRPRGAPQMERVEIILERVAHEI